LQLVVNSWSLNANGYQSDGDKKLSEVEEQLLKKVISAWFKNGCKTQDWQANKFM